MAKDILKSCGTHSAKLLKYVWPFFNIMHDRINLLRRQPHKMVKHTQTISRQQPTNFNCLNVLDHFVGLALKGLKTKNTYIYLGLTNDIKEEKHQYKQNIT